jgi:hypothetical protein
MLEHNDGSAVLIVGEANLQFGTHVGDQSFANQSARWLIRDDLTPLELAAIANSLEDPAAKPRARERTPRGAVHWLSGFMTPATRATAADRPY